MMDRYTCKLCFRRFSNGRALGGHMRSHVTLANTNNPSMRSHVTLANTNNPSKAKQQEAESPSSSASANQREPEASEQVAEVGDQAAATLMEDREVEAARVDEAKQLVYYGLRENPRKSFRLVDPEFSSMFPVVDYAGGVAGGGSSVVLLDRESDTESSKPPSLRRRSKRRRRSPPLLVGKSDPSVEPEPVSSISDATPEEDVARCLMMLSRDVWDNSSSPDAKSKRSARGDVEEVEEAAAAAEEEEEQNSDDDSEEELIAVVKSRRGGRTRYQCDTCRKVFRSYQALGGHRASHKKVKACTMTAPAATPASVVAEEEDDDARPYPDNAIQDADSEVIAAPSTGSTGRKIHECPVCFRVFGSGQALGGHKRSHLAYTCSTANPSVVVVTSATAVPRVAASAAASPADDHRAGKLVGESLIDLNLPPPMDEETEMSAVCDGEQ